jgi:ubiquinone/menaquinone biosynthesis C-methylase UbiE
MSIKLHLGCGEKRIEGYINIDCRPLPTVDSVQNVKLLRSYKHNTVDVLYASHVLEHFGRWEYEHILQRWFDIIKPGGLLRLSVPDFSSICKHYNKNENLEVIMGLLYGGQDYSENYHYVAFDFSSLKKTLIKIGFKEVSIWDWRKTEHSHIDDFSQAYLPHMDKENGMLMSLNIEAIK